MIEINISNDLLKKASNYKKFRSNLKFILKKYNKSFDKFTVTDNDSFLGYISETLVSSYLVSNNIPIIQWESEVKLSRDLKLKVLENHNDNFTPDEINTLTSYFYDKWDIKYKDVYADVKTAATSYKPKDTWTFGFPVIQANKKGKTHAILTYVFYDKDPKEYSDANPEKLYIWGYLHISDIKKCDINNKNIDKGYSYQINNHITKLEDYNKNILTLFE